MEPDFTIRKVAIIGARGQMGGLFAARCRDAGIEVAAVDRPLTDEKIAAGFAGADIVYVSVPAAAMAQVMERIQPFLAPPHILVDNVSVKVAPLKDMARCYDGPIVGTHPLFGPVPPDEARVAVTPGRADDPGRDEAAMRVVEDWTLRLGFTPFRTTAEQHDKAAAQIQGLNFVTTVAYLAALGQQEDILPFLTPSFERRLVAAKKMVMEDAELFAGMFEANPFGQDAVRRFRNFLHVAAGGDVDILIDRARWWFREERDA
ncbi:MAG: prephenate dehydrogenase/arogenate dehydrogenase family protein [Desulfovibrionaceae bacterium]